MGNLLLVMSLMAVPMMILVAIGYLNRRDDRWPTAARIPPATQRPPLREATKYTH